MSDPFPGISSAEEPTDRMTGLHIVAEYLQEKNVDWMWDESRYYTSRIVRIGRYILSSGGSGYGNILFVDFGHHGSLSFDLCEPGALDEMWKFINDE